MSGASGAPDQVVNIDPFDLPEWLGTARVTWSGSDLGSGHLVRGELTGDDDEQVACDLIAVDQAYPAPVVDETTRRRVHQAWRHGQVLVVCRRDRSAVATPGTTYTPADVLEAVTRLARAVGADPVRWSVRLALGSR